MTVGLGITLSGKEKNDKNLTAVIAECYAESAKFYCPKNEEAVSNGIEFVNLSGVEGQLKRIIGISTSLNVTNSNFEVASSK